MRAYIADQVQGNDDFAVGVGRVFDGAKRRLDPATLDPDSDEAQLMTWALEDAVRLYNLVAELPRTSLRMPDICVGLIDDPEINAVAFEDGGRYFVGFFRGAAYQIFDVAFRLLSHPEILTSVGDPSREKVRASHLVGLVRNPNQVADARSSGETLWSQQPVDPVRRACARWLAIRMFRFLALHELGHIRHGHLGYMGSLTGFSVVIEQVTTDNPAVADLTTSQTLEMDADSFATTNSVMALLAADERSRGTSGLPPEVDVLLKIHDSAETQPLVEVPGMPSLVESNWNPRDLRESMETLCTGISLVHCMFGMDILGECLDDEDHPHPAHRHFMNMQVVDVAFGLCGRIGPSQGDYLLGADMIDRIADANLKMGGGKWLAHHAVLESNRLGKMLGDRTEQILERWKQIRPDLLKRTFTPDLAP